MRDPPQAKAEYANYYKNSLLYLACVNVQTDLSPVERVQRAHDLGLSALLGTIYNFGELVGEFLSSNCARKLTNCNSIVDASSFRIIGNDRA